MPAYRFGVLGAGRQGTAAAYDLVARGEATSVILADLDAGRAAAAAIFLWADAGLAPSPCTSAAASFIGPPVA